jgi:CD109 antigen
MENLTEYAYLVRLRDITDMSVFLEASASTIGEPVRISSDSLAKVHQMDITFS